MSWLQNALSIQQGLDALTVRTLVLVVPAVALFVIWSVRSPTKRARAGALQAGLWCFVSLFALHVVGGRLWHEAGFPRGGPWWSYQTDGGMLSGLPIDIWIGWALAWGPLLALSLPTASVIGIAAGVAALDIVFMPLMAPTVKLGPNWLVGEALAILACLVPGLLLSRWTREDRRLGARAGLQVAAFGMLMLILVPAVSIAASDRTWLLPLPSWRSVAWRLLVFPGIVGLAAVYEFVRRGSGTPVPWDPPKRLVTSGPYAFVANPMQMAAVTFIALIGVARGSGWILFAAVWSFFVSVGLVAWAERMDMEHRFGAPWKRYRRNVRNWIPRWRPWHPSAPDSERSTGASRGDPAQIPAEPSQPAVPPPARVYVSFGCTECSAVGRFVERMNPVGLEVWAAEAHPSRDLARITYDPMDGGPEDEGVAAIARILEHVNLGLGFGGFVLRSPVIRPVVQAIVDAAGYGPMPVTRTCAHPQDIAAVSRRGGVKQTD